MIADSSSDYARFDELAEEFAARYRRGERPNLQEYIDRCPAMAEEIRGLFPAMVEVERVERAFEPPDPSPLTRVLRERLADFRIVGEIGRGGMGVVHEAEQVSLGRRVALKVLPKTLKRDARSLARFRREARSAAQLHHTNIVPVFEVGEDSDSVFYAMQFIRGQGLNLVIEELKRLRDRSPGGCNPEVAVEEDGVEVAPIGPTGAANPATEAHALDRMAQSLLIGRFVDETIGPGTVGAELAGSGVSHATDGDATIAHLGHPPDPAVLPTDRSSAVWPGGDTISLSESPGRRQPFFRSVAEIGRQVAGGLAYAHARGIVHRDIKPANLLLDTAGVAWIADFGLAKSGDDGLTETGDILGTLRFMAPERFRGEGDGRADIYALGVTLYEMLTLRPAFESADRLRLIEEVRNVEPPRPRSVDPTIPRDLETVVLKGMAKEPSARYASALEMAEDLRRYLAGETIHARRTGLVERFWRWGRRNPLAASSIGAVAAMLIVVVVATSISARRERAMRLDADSARRRAESALADLREARSEESTIRRAVATERENLRKDPSNRDTRGSLDSLYSQQAALQRRAGRKADAVETALARRDLNPGMPDRLYQVAMDLADCLPRRGGKSEPGDLDAAGAGRAANLAVDALGKAILAGFRSKEYAITFEIGSNARLRVLHPLPAYQSLLGSLGRKDLTRGGGEILAFRGHHSVVESVAITPDGKRVLSVGADRTAILWDLKTGRPVHPPFVHPNSLRGVAITSDGRSAAIGCNDGLVHFWNLDDGTEAGTFAGHSGPVHGVGLTPDGKTLVSAGSDGTLRVWDVERREERSRLEGHRGEVIDLAVSRDGRRAVSTGDDETVRVWDIGQGREVHEPLRGHHGRVWSVAITPDGRRAWTGADDGGLIEWDIVEGRRLRTLTAQGATIRGIAISPDGRRAVTGGPQDRFLYWDLESGRELHRFLGDFGGGMVCVATSPDGRRAVTGSTDAIARVWTLSEDAALARDLATVGRWDEALDAYGLAVEAEPDDTSIRVERDSLAWRLGRWPVLASDHDRYVRDQPEYGLARLNQARVLLMAGDREGYRRACAAMRDRLNSSKYVQHGELALASMLAPDSGVGPANAVAVADASVERDPRTPWAHQALGLAQYRAGRDKQAILTLLNLAHLHEGWGHMPSAWPVLALAYRRIGNAAEAAKWLEKTREIRRLKTPRFGRDPIATTEPWSDVASWIDFELLAREAEASIGDTSH